MYQNTNKTVGYVRDNGVLWQISGLSNVSRKSLFDAEDESIYRRWKYTVTRIISAVNVCRGGVLLEYLTLFYDGIIENLHNPYITVRYVQDNGGGYKIFLDSPEIFVLTE